MVTWFSNLFIIFHKEIINKNKVNTVNDSELCDYTLYDCVCDE